MTDRAIGPLRRRMIEDMTVRSFTVGTQRGYIRAVRDFTALLGRAPDRADAADLRRYQLHMRSLGAFDERRRLGLALLFGRHTGARGCSSQAKMIRCEHRKAPNHAPTNSPA